MAPADPLAPSVWHVAVAVPRGTEAAAEAALDPDGIAVSVRELDRADLFCVETWMEAEPDLSTLTVRLAVAAAAAGVDPPAVRIRKVDGRDWLEATRRAFPPLPIGRFVVHGSHAEPPPPGRIGLRIDANLAFGTGEHPTTEGCLRALEDLARRHRVRRMLDMGGGTAVLAMAAARLWPARCLAVDIDPGSVSVARLNVLANGLHPRVRAVCGDGFATPAVRRTEPFDLITANILARPLAAMAPALARALAPRGHAVLSGLTGGQEPGILAIYRAHGLYLVTRRRLGVWSTLVLARRRARP